MCIHIRIHIYVLHLLSAYCMAGTILNPLRIYLYLHKNPMHIITTFILHIKN